MSQRTERLDSQIQQELMGLLQREMKDPRLGFATVTRVSTTRDLRHVTAWISVYGDEEARARSMAALVDATPWMQRQLGQRLRMRHVPTLAVRPDDSIEAGDRVLRLLHEVASHEAAGEEAGSSDGEDGSE